MASQLEQSTELAKKIGIGCLIFIVIILLGNFIINLFKKPEPPYNPFPQYAKEEFGDLPNIELSSLEISDKTNPEYKIETTDGQIPNLPSIVYVYKVKTPRQSLTAEDDAKSIAESLNFREDPNPISETELEWIQGERVLTINKLYKTVSIKTAYPRLESEERSNDIEPHEHVYINAASSFLNQAGLFPSQYDQANLSSLIYLKLNSNFELVQAKSAQDANFVRVDFFRNFESVGVTIPPGASDEEKEQYESYRVFSQGVLENPYEGAVSIILGSSSNKNQIYELSYTDWELENRSTYYLQGENNAWEQVIQGNGYLRSLMEINSNPFSIYSPREVKSFLLTDVDVVYLIPKSYQKYILPVYRFSGIAISPDDDEADLEFNIYYPAIKQESNE